MAAGVEISIPAPPRGASKSHLPPTSRAMNFNTSPSTRGFIKKYFFDPVLRDFNTSPSTRGFRINVCLHRSRLYFNTSPSTRGFCCSWCLLHEGLFQYQPLHEGLLCQPIAVVPP